MTRDYVLIVSGKLGKFESDVARALDEGWELHGPPSAVVQDGGIVFLQALTSTDEDEEELGE